MGVDSEVIHATLQRYSEVRFTNPEDVSDALKIWATLKSATSGTNNLAFVLRRFRQVIMLSVFTMWTFMADIYHAIDVAFTHPILTPALRWIYDLAMEMDNWFSENSTERIFDRPSYLLDIPSKPLRVPAQEADVMQNVDLRRERIQGYLRYFALTWLEYPKPTVRPSTTNAYQNWDVQGPFVHHLLKLSGTRDVLLLDRIWDCFCSVRKHVLEVPASVDTGVNSPVWGPLISHLRSLFPEQPTGESRLAQAALVKYGRICHEACAGRLADLEGHLPEIILEPSRDPSIQAAASALCFIEALLPLLSLSGKLN